jgi:hypothetical protein
MSDSYQAIYDAVRSRISGGNIADAVTEVARSAFDISHMTFQIKGDIDGLLYDLSQPFTRLRPKMYLDGNMWCALYGENIQEGVCGFGGSPQKASEAFNAAWFKEVKP